MFKPQARYTEVWNGKVIVLSPGYLPTIDFYIRSRADLLCNVSLNYRDSRSAASLETAPEKGIFFIIVRYAGRSWLKYIDHYRGRLSGVAFLMDDDIPAAYKCQDVPIDYGLWTSFRYLRFQSMLSSVCDRLWVSTNVLLSRYSDSSPRLLLPVWGNFEKPRPASAGCFRWGYHGTRVHWKELRWLVPVVQAVHHELASAEFEVFGGPRVARLFSGIPRVRVLLPRGWTDYLDYCKNNELAVGLAPMFPGRFNDARSFVKIYDILRCGAVGVFSDCPAYRDVLNDIQWRMLPLLDKMWVSEIVNILSDQNLRFRKFNQLAAVVKKTRSADSFSDLINN